MSAPKAAWPTPGRKRRRAAAEAAKVLRRIVEANTGPQSQVSATTPDQVLRWIIEANTGRERSRKTRLTAADIEVQRIANLINEQHELYWQDPTGEEAAWEVLHQKIRDVRTAVRALTLALPPVLKAFEGRGVYELVREGDSFARQRNRTWVALTRLLEAAHAASGAIGEPPTGRPAELWTVWTYHLMPLIHDALMKAGRSRVSLNKPEGPLVKVVCRALRAIDGKEHSPEKVASGLRRRR